MCKCNGGMAGMEESGSENGSRDGVSDKEETGSENGSLDIFTVSTNDCNSW